MENVFISNKNELERKIELIKADGASKLHIVSDFDKTITRYRVNGKPVSSVIAILRDEGYLTEDYPVRAKELFTTYHPFEIDKSILWEDRKAKMLEWWSTHYVILKECGLTKDDLESIIQSDSILFREGYEEFFKMLDVFNVPLTLVTANGLGGDVIKMILDRFNVKSDDIYLVANEIIWDEFGKFAGIKEPIIHVLNKGEVIIEDQRIFERIKDRHNVILLGDGEGDIGMVQNIKYDNIIKIGYLNEKEEELKERFLEIFDVVITNDGSFEYINKLLKNILNF